MDSEPAATIEFICDYTLQNAYRTYITRGCVGLYWDHKWGIKLNISRWYIFCCAT